VLVNVDPTGKRERTTGDDGPKDAKLPSKRQTEEGCSPPERITSARPASSTATSSETYTVGGVTISNARASSSAAAGTHAAPQFLSASQFAALLGPPTPGVGRNYLPHHRSTPLHLNTCIPFICHVVICIFIIRTTRLRVILICIRIASSSSRASTPQRSTPASSCCLRYSFDGSFDLGCGALGQPQSARVIKL
jgi:hypothetical protein